LEGDGVNQSIDKAMEWIERAAKKGDAAAQHEYAEALYHLEQPADAFYWMKKSAENGYKSAKGALAVLYLNGIGTERNIEQGIKWIRQAADDGDANAKMRLGSAYIEGIGVPADKEKGLALLREAAALGESKANELIMYAMNQGRSDSDKSGGCYVATCVYGSYDCPEVWTLRRFRDNILSQFILGRLFIYCYYACSLQIVKCVGHKKWFHKLWKPLLNKFVCFLQRNGI
jgi:TPR repeat protein